MTTGSLGYIKQQPKKHRQRLPMQKIIFTFSLLVFFHSIILAATQINPCEFVRLGMPKTVGEIEESVVLVLRDDDTKLTNEKAGLKEVLMGVEYESDLDRCLGQYQAYTKIVATGTFRADAVPGGIFGGDHAYASGYVKLQIDNDVILEQSISIADKQVALPLSFGVALGQGVQGSVSWTPTWSILQTQEQNFKTNVGYIQTPTDTWIDHPPKTKISFTKTVALHMGASVVKTGTAYASVSILSPVSQNMVIHANGLNPLRPLMTFRSKP
jgi:hypothetical protein